MKIKQIPADFIVRENTRPDLPMQSKTAKGPYSVYRLNKQSIGTIEAINVIRNTWGIRSRRVSFGGLKDKWAQTEQLISIFKGAPKDMDHKRFTLKYLGKSAEPINTGSFNSNQFTICLRDMSKAETDKAQKRLKEIEMYGLPNYYDSQRFGSIRGGNDFAAKYLIRGDYEGALKTVLTAGSPDDYKTVRDLRAIVSRYWGRWDDCFSALVGSGNKPDVSRVLGANRIIKYLKYHPRNFLQAYELIDDNLSLLYLNAYQNYLWNKGVARLLTKYANKRRLLHYTYILGNFVFYKSLPAKTLEKFKTLIIPFVTHRTEFEDEEIKQLFGQILAEEGIAQPDFKIRHMKKNFFHRGQRRVLVFPEGVCVPETGTDEFNAGRYKMVLQFSLPRGAYATMLIKRLSYDFDKA